MLFSVLNNFIRKKKKKTLDDSKNKSCQKIGKTTVQGSGKTSVLCSSFQLSDTVNAQNKAHLLWSQWQNSRAEIIPFITNCILFITEFKESGIKFCLLFLHFNCRIKTSAPLALPVLSDYKGQLALPLQILYLALESKVYWIWASPNKVWFHRGWRELFIGNTPIHRVIFFFCNSNWFSKYD